MVKIDTHGDWVTSFGEPGTGPGQFQTPHAIAIENQDRIYVAETSNWRVQKLRLRPTPAQTAAGR